MSYSDRSKRHWEASRYGVPVNPNLTREEQILKSNNEQLKFMEKSVAIQESNQKLDIDNIKNLNEITKAQSNLAQSVEEYGYTGKMLLENSQVQVDAIKSLDNHAIQAYHQRNALLGSVGDMKDVLCSALSDIDYEIRQTNKQLTNEIIQTRLEIINELQDFKDVFSWSHKEQMVLNSKILDTLKTPQKTKSDESWEMGEKSRKVLDFNNATRMFWRSLEDNPTEARSYFSLGLIYLNYFDSSYAKNLFYFCLKYSDSNEKLKLQALMYLAKLEKYDNNFDQSIALFQEIVDIEPSNLEAHYELVLYGEEKIHQQSRVMLDDGYNLKIKSHPNYKSFLINGNDTLYCPNGDIFYKGYLKDSVFNGEGIDYQTNRSGNFLNGLLNGRGKKQNKEGIFKNDIRVAWIDNNTGLTWEVKTNTCFKDKLLFSQTDFYVKKLNKQKYAGFSDWRLPTLKELKSIIITSQLNDDMVNRYEFWSSTLNLKEEYTVLGISFKDKKQYYYSTKTNKNYIRLVRG